MNKFHIRIGLIALGIVIGIWNFYILGIEWVAYQETKRSYSQTRALIQFSQSVGDFVHESQKERGLSAAYLGSNGDIEFKSRLNKQRLISDKKFLALLQRVKTLSRYSLPENFHQSIQTSIEKQKQLEDIREHVNNLSISTSDEIDFYTELNANFLGLLPLSAKSAPTREIALRLYDITLLVECTEKAAIERGTLASVFAAKRFEPGMYEKVISVHAIHQSCKQSFLDKASNGEHSLYNAYFSHKLFLDSHHIYEQVLRGDFSMGATQWFNHMTVNIDQLKMLNEKFDQMLEEDLSQLEEKTLLKHEIFLVGSFAYGFFMLLGAIYLVQQMFAMINTLRISSVVFDSNEGVLVADINGKIIRVNSAFEKISGYSESEVLGRTPALFKSGLNNSQFYHDMWFSLIHKGFWNGELYNRRKNGEMYPEYLSISAVRDEYQKITHYVGIFSDITAKKENEERIYRLAFYDPLTQLPNRRLLFERLEHALIKNERNKTYSMVAFIDLDNFKIVNDTKGHLVGDELLKEAGKRLLEVTRAEDTVARLGGDEFVILIEDLGSSREQAFQIASKIGSKISLMLQKPFEIYQELFFVTGSIGIAILHDYKQTVNEILAQADTAMYSAKESGKNTFRFFDSALQQTMLKKLECEKILFNALEENQFQLFYQLQYNHQNEVSGAEALIRWFHPEKGIISPTEFIPIAEENGFITEIGKWVIAEACKTLHEWSHDPIQEKWTLSINISPKQFFDESFTTVLLDNINAYAICPSRLRLEVTESLLINDIEKIQTIMYRLKAHGFTFSLDDFGTGYSSLSYLNRFPFDELKIDQSFIRNMENDPHASALVRAIITMAEVLGLEIVAEGVELSEQHTILQSIGGIHYQGYLFSKPVSKNEMQYVLSREHSNV